MKIRKNILKVSIDSPAAAGAGTQAKLIGKHLTCWYWIQGAVIVTLPTLKQRSQQNLITNMLKKKLIN